MKEYFCLVKRLQTILAFGKQEHLVTRQFRFRLQGLGLENASYIDKMWTLIFSTENVHFLVIRMIGIDYHNMQCHSS